MAEDTNAPKTPVNGQTLQPGVIISPRAEDPASEQQTVNTQPSSTPTNTVAEAPLPTAIPPALQTSSLPLQPHPLPDTATPEPSSPSPYAEASLQISNNADVSWTASEFIAHEKSAGWYAMLGLAAVIIAAIVFLLTKDKISTTVVIFGALTLGVYGSRQPRQLDYTVDSSGIKIGQKFHAYDEFRSFAILPEGAFSSIVFMPLKRFAPLTTIYYAPADEDKIVALLAERLPLEERQLDAVDQFMRRIRF